MSLQQWQQFLQESAKQNPVRTISDISVSDTVLCDLSHLGLLQIEGADAVTFLQGQVTNDVKQLDGHRAHYTGYCNPKGRLLALFLAFSHQDHIHLQMPKALIESIAKRLKMYVMRSKVEIQDVSESIIKIGINGSNATELLSTLFTAVPQNTYELATLDNSAILKLPGDKPRFEIFTDIANAPAIWDALSKQAKTVDTQYWEWLEIQAGIPEVYPSTQEEFVPQMLNLDLLDGISFKKGCYTGQEIVARTHYLGTIKRRTQLAHINTQPNVGDDVVNGNQESIGKIVRCAPAPGSGYDVQAEIRLESMDAGQLLVGDSPLKIQPLPYKI
ncbi:MAG: folate-binding protein YgfZ [Methylotenera sp.]